MQAKHTLYHSSYALPLDLLSVVSLSNRKAVFPFLLGRVCVFLCFVR